MCTCLNLIYDYMQYYILKPFFITYCLSMLLQRLRNICFSTVHCTAVVDDYFMQFNIYNSIIHSIYERAPPYLFLGILLIVTFCYINFKHITYLPIIHLLLRNSNWISNKQLLLSLHLFNQFLPKSVISV